MWRSNSATGGGMKRTDNQYDTNENKISNISHLV